MPRGKPNKRYTPEFKIKVVETMQKENLSYKEAAREFDVSFDTVVAKMGTNLSVAVSNLIQRSNSILYSITMHRPCERTVFIVRGYMCES